MNQTEQPPRESFQRVAVIGAGISGLNAANTLAAHGCSVTVFEKSRGVGGRMATRRFKGEASFDHGAQYFTVRDERFRNYIDKWIENRIVAAWPNVGSDPNQRIVVLNGGKIESESNSVDRYVGVPGMNAICKQLAVGLDVRLQTQVAEIRLIGQSINLVDDQQSSLGIFDRLIVSAPAGQTAELLVNFPTLAETISKSEMSPCWAAMVSFDNPITDQWAGAFLKNSFLSWTARNSTKEGRSCENENIVIHAIPDWTLKKWEQDPVEVANEMLAEFWRVTGLNPQSATHSQAHRWKYAIPVEPSENRCYLDTQSGIAACGDWACGSRVEGAFLSGLAAANSILETLNKPPVEIDHAQEKGNENKLLRSERSQNGSM